MLIHGIVVTRNNWGVLALSITNALVNHADVVHVLNHGSSDQTADGLNILKDIWGDRLKVYSTGPDVPFDQSLLTNMLASLAEDEGADWIYVFDSDEFLLTSQNFSLKQELSKLNNSEVGARYSLSNYISTYDFDENDLKCYKELIYKSIPSNKHKLLLSHVWPSIYAGELTFFDVPFPSKLIFRANKKLLISGGAHSLKYLLNGQSIKNLTSAECAHLSLISKNRLFGKSALGKTHIDKGHSKETGWQNQLIHQLEVEGKLDSFWENHSIQTGNKKNKNPNYVEEEEFVKCLNKSIEILKEKFGGENLSMLFGVSLRTGCAKESNFTLDRAIQICNFFDKKVDLLLRANKKK